MDMVTLRDGTKVPMPTAKTTLISLAALNRGDGSDYLALFEIVAKARDTDHQFFDPALPRLRSLSLVTEDGALHDDVAAVIRNAATGDDFDIRLDDPSTDGSL